LLALKTTSFPLVQKSKQPIGASLREISVAIEKAYDEAISGAALDIQIASR